MAEIVNPLFFKYELVCTHPGCKGRRIEDQGLSAGLRLGELVPGDPSRFEYARCPICKRCLMKVNNEPPRPKNKQIKGFTKLPTE